MFGKKLPEGSTISAEVRLRIGAGHPLTAWSGSPTTPDHDVIEDISRNTIVSKYLYKAIARGKLKQDEMGAVPIPAFLCALEDNVQIEEHKIEIVLMLVSGDGDGPNPAVMFDKMFSIYSAAMKDLSSLHNMGIIESQKTLSVTAAQSAKILEAAAEPMTKTLGIMEQAYNHESKRADAAADAIVRMLIAKGQDKQTDLVDDLVRLAGIAPILLSVIEKLKGTK